MKLNTTNRYSYRSVFLVVLAVYIFFALLGLIAGSVSPSGEAHYRKFFSWRSIASQVFGLFYLSFFYYFTANIFYRLIFQKKSTLSFIKVFVLSALALALYFTAYYFISDQKVNKEFTIGLLIFSFAVSSFFQLCLSILIPYLTYLRDERKQRKILEEQKLQLEVEKSQANFNFLKAQINPHFLHNTLNFLYAKALPLSSDLSEGILTLSDIMRYALSEGNARDGRAPLKDEIEHVQNVIKIQQLRFDNKLNVQFEVSGTLEGAFIIPFVLITLVENAFKHGDLKNTEHPIEIRATVRDKKLHFYCRNKKKTGPKEISTGIGLDNIKKRLELAYKQNYRFTVNDSDGFYITELEIFSL